MKNINTTVLVLGFISVLELFLANEIGYSLLLWVFYGIWRVIKLITTGK